MPFLREGEYCLILNYFELSEDWREIFTAGFERYMKEQSNPSEITVFYDEHEKWVGFDKVEKYGIRRATHEYAWTHNLSEIEADNKASVIYDQLLQGVADWDTIVYGREPTHNRLYVKEGVNEIYSLELNRPFPFDPAKDTLKSLITEATVRINKNRKLFDENRNALKPKKRWTKRDLERGHIAKVAMQNIDDDMLFCQELYETLTPATDDVRGQSYYDNEGRRIAHELEREGWRGFAHAHWLEEERYWAYDYEYVKKYNDDADKLSEIGNAFAVQLTLCKMNSTAEGRGCQ